MVANLNPDIVVATPFISEAVLESYRKKIKTHFRIAVTLTDYEFHPVWVVSNVDSYFTAAEEVKSSLLFHGIPPEKIVTSGIPIHPKFSKERDRKEFLARSEVIEDFRSIKEEFQIMVVCENNADLKKIWR
jgi:processive 1,2-diacylglycerol beta-glucosyltransferase